jgi:hypothetical protein
MYLLWPLRIIPFFLSLIIGYLNTSTLKDGITITYGTTIMGLSTLTQNL